MRYGIAGAIPVESSYGQNDPKALTTLRPMQYLSYRSRLVELAGGGKHYDVKLSEGEMHRITVWLDS